MDEYVGERIVIVDNQSPSYRLKSLSYKDLFSVDGRVNPKETTDVEFPIYALPSTIRVACTEPFGEGVFFSVDRVSKGEEKGFYIPEEELVETGCWESLPHKLYAPLDTQFNRMRLNVSCKKTPQRGHIFWHVEFRYLT